MSLLLIALAVPVLYYAGAPLAAYLRSQVEMIIIKGAPGYPYSQSQEQSNTQSQTQSQTQSKTHSLDLSSLKSLDGNTTNTGEGNIPALGSQYGTILCDRIGLSVPLYYGDSDSVLQKGAGQYSRSGLPGEGRTILISGHDVTFFAPLEDMIEGDIVNILTDYDSFNYQVTDIRVTDNSDKTAYDLDSDQEQLILYTCYPFGKLIGESKGRIFYYCSPIIY